MIGKNDDKLIQEIKMGLDCIDDHMEVKTPDIRQFRQLVAKVEERKREKTVFETVIFIFSAILILCIETFTFSKSTAVFAGVQVFALLTLPVVMLINKKRDTRRVDVYEK